MAFEIPQAQRSAIQYFAPIRTLSNEPKSHTPARVNECNAKWFIQPKRDNINIHPPSMPGSRFIFFASRPLAARFTSHPLRDLQKLLQHHGIVPCAISPGEPGFAESAPGAFFRSSGERLQSSKPKGRPFWETLMIFYLPQTVMIQLWSVWITNSYVWDGTAKLSIWIMTILPQSSSIRIWATKSNSWCFKGGANF